MVSLRPQNLLFYTLFGEYCGEHEPFLRQSEAMSRFGRVVGRRAGPWGAAFALWEIWKRIPPKHRKRLLQQARKHGPKLVKQALKTRRRA
jgi:hypothetical protein